MLGCCVLAWVAIAWGAELGPELWGVQVFTPRRGSTQTFRMIATAITPSKVRISMRVPMLSPMSLDPATA